MNRPEFIERVAEKYDISKRAAGDIVEMYTETLKECLIIGEPVSISGLYSISLKDKKAREGVDPRTLERIIIPPMRTPHCRFSGVLRKEINGR